MPARGTGSAEISPHRSASWQPNQTSESCFVRRAASAPAWCGPSIPSSGRSTIYGAPVYVRHEIVHNKYVVDSLKTKGAIFVEELAEIPDSTNAPVVFSAHGVPKSVPAEAQSRNFFSLDATCPLVTKVHREAAIHFKRGREILLIGHSHHPEVVGTVGQLPAGAVTLIETAEDAASFTPKDPNNLAFVTQTTLSIDDTEGHRRDPEGPVPEHLRARTRKTSATPPPTASWRSRRWRPWSTP